MPTIDELPPASASADTDELLCNQGGISRKLARSQLLANTQPFIALSQGQLVGRADAGAGGVQPISLGPNLTLSANTLNGAAPFVVAGLPAAAGPTVADVVPLAQSGRNVAASYAQFMAGLPNVSGVSGNALTARATGASNTRTIADLMANAVAAEDFGAVGDGVTDNAAALAAAIAAGQPVRLGPKTYAISGQWTVFGASAVLLGVPGQTVLKRIRQTGNGAWISVQSTKFRADGVTFDANASVATDSWNVLVTPTCTSAEFHRCVFANARGSTQGSGLTFQAADPVVTQHAVVDCEAAGNAVHGIWVQAVQTVHVALCRAHDNGQYGICIDYADPALIQKIKYCQVTGCQAWNNQRGISIGNYNATNTVVPVWGNANPDAISALVSNNICHDNSIYGIAAAGKALNVINNTMTNNGLPGGAGLLVNVAYSRVAGNVVTGSSYYGIDAGGCIMTDISGNHVSGAVHGITPGGGLNVRAAGNYVQDCTGWSFLVNNVETDGNGRNFGMSTNNLTIDENWIGFSIGSGGGGILLADNPQGVRVTRNTIVGSGAASIGQALWPNSTSVSVSDNTWNFSVSAPVATSASAAGLNQVVYPDLLDTVILTDAPTPVQSLVSIRQQALIGQLGFIAVTAGGTGYTTATLTITGDGTGATAVAYVSGGALIGIALGSGGSGYSAANVVISGDGTGAAASAQISLPLPEQRVLTVRCATQVVFARAGSAPAQQNWTNYDCTVPDTCDVTFTARKGSWRAGPVPLADYLLPDGSGGNALVTKNTADLVLRPAGRVRIASSTEAAGASSSIGRGSPVGVVSATPGSDYRNLNGGVGATYWVKQTGTGNAGWVAVA